MKNLLVKFDSMDGACSLYRGMGPVSEMRRQYDDFNCTLFQQHTWSTLSMVDGVFSQRPCDTEQLNVLRLAKLNRKPIWIDYDDMMFNVPWSNKMYSKFSDEKIQKNIREALETADFVSVTTQGIANSFDEIRIAAKKPPCRIIPNAWNENWFPDYPERTSQRKDIVLWRGSDTHDHDVAIHIEGITDAARANPKWMFVFVGNPGGLACEHLKGIKNVVMSNAMDPMEYFSLLRNLSAKLMIVPLADNRFNRGKSNIAWQEAAYAGCVPIVPDMPEWDQPGSLKYRDPKDFARVLRDAMSGAVDLRSCRNDGWSAMQNWKLSDMNLSRRRILIEMGICRSA